MDYTHILCVSFWQGEGSGPQALLSFVVPGAPSCLLPLWDPLLHLSPIGSRPHFSTKNSDLATPRTLDPRQLFGEHSLGPGQGKRPSVAEETLGSQRRPFITTVVLVVPLFESGLGPDTWPAIRQLATGGQQEAKAVPKNNTQLQPSQRPQNPRREGSTPHPRLLPRERSPKPTAGQESETELESKDPNFLLFPMAPVLSWTWTGGAWGWGSITSWSPSFGARGLWGPLGDSLSSQPNGGVSPTDPHGSQREDTPTATLGLLRAGGIRAGERMALGAGSANEPLPGRSVGVSSRKWGAPRLDTCGA